MPRMPGPSQKKFPFARKPLTQREIRERVRSKMDAFGAFEARHKARADKRAEQNRKRNSRKMNADRRG